MSALRHRIGGVLRETPSPYPSPRDRVPNNGEEVQLVPVSKLKGLTTKRRSKRRSWLIFGLGGLVGICIALFFANRQEVINLEGLIDFNLESFLDVIPAGIVKDAQDITVCTSSDVEPLTKTNYCRKQSVMLSITIHSPLAFTCRPRESVRTILSS